MKGRGWKFCEDKAPTSILVSIEKTSIDADSEPIFLLFEAVAERFHYDISATLMQYTPESESHPKSFIQINKEGCWHLTFKMGLDTTPHRLFLSIRANPIGNPSLVCTSHHRAVLGS